MKDPRPPDRAAAARRAQERARELLRDGLGAAEAFAADLALRWRRASRHLRLRAAVIGAWALLSAGTIWAACPPSGPTNALGAKVQLLSAREREMLLGSQIFVENDSSRLWRDVVLTLDGGWRHERTTIRPRDKLVVAVTQFRRDGESAPPDLEPRTLTIECDEGRITAPLLGR